jgi:adenylate cyclase
MTDPTPTPMLSRDELETAAGAGPDVIDQLLEAGLIHHGGDGGFAPATVARVRLVLGLETSGLSRGTIVQAVNSGAFPLEFIDQLMPDPVQLKAESYEESFERLDIDEEAADALRTVLGSARAHESQQIRTDDAAFFELWAQVKAFGADDRQLLRVVRTYADAVRRIIGAERDFVDEVLIGPAADAGMTEREILETTSAVRQAYRTAGVRLVAILHDRFVDDALFQNLVLHGERAIAAAGLAQPRSESPEAVVFVDVTGYTALAEEFGDEAAVEAAAILAELVQLGAVLHGGRLVKLLGDGAMLHFDDVRSAVLCVLALLERAATSPIPPLHVGVAAGRTVRRDGDYFGSIVNLASRAADRAGPSQILATDIVRDAWEGGEVIFEPIGAVTLKNVPRPVELFEVSPSDFGDGPG